MMSLTANVFYRGFTNLKMNVENLREYICKIRGKIRTYETIELLKHVIQHELYNKHIE